MDGSRVLMLLNAKHYTIYDLTHEMRVMSMDMKPTLMRVTLVLLYVLWSSLCTLLDFDPSCPYLTAVPFGV